MYQAIKVLKVVGSETTKKFLQEGKIYGYLINASNHACFRDFKHPELGELETTEVFAHCVDNNFISIVTRNSSILIERVDNPIGRKVRRASSIEIGGKWGSHVIVNIKDDKRRPTFADVKEEDELEENRLYGNYYSFDRVIEKINEALNDGFGVKFTYTETLIKEEEDTLPW